MNRVGVLVLSGVLVAGGVAGDARSGETPVAGEMPGGYVTEVVPGFAFSLDPAQPFVFYVVERWEGLDGAVVTIQPFARQGAGFTALERRTFAATGVMTGARVGDRFHVVRVEG